MGILASKHLSNSLGSYGRGTKKRLRAFWEGLGNTFPQILTRWKSEVHASRCLVEASHAVLAFL